MSRLTDFIRELRRRRVFRVTGLYIVGAWVVLQVAALAFPAFNVPEGAIRYVFIGSIIGFPIALFFGWRYEITNGQLIRTPKASAEPDLSLRRADFAIIGTLGIIAIVVTIGVLEEISETQTPDTAQYENVVYDPASIAVLPFVNNSPDPEQEYFSDGIAEELLNLLARIPELRVTSRSTSFSLKGQDFGVPEAARMMNVAHILEGSVRKTGDQVRIAVQLIAAETDTQLWSGSYDRKLVDVFAIQNEIAEEIVSELKIELLDGPPKAEEIDPRAFELYLQARKIIHTGLDKERVQEAKDKLERMLEYEPNFVPAISELARTHLRIGQVSGEPAVWEESKMNIRALVAQLVEIAPSSSYALGWQGFMAQYWDGDYQKAARYRERALAAPIDSNFNLQLLQASILMSTLRRHEEALAIADYVVSRDPACTPCVLHLSRLLRSAGRPREAAERVETILDWTKGNPRIYETIGFAWLFAGEPAVALRYFDQTDMSAIVNAGRLIAVHSLSLTGQFNSEFKDFREKNSDQPELIAAIYASTGQNDEAFAWLEKMLESQDHDGSDLIRIGFFDRLRLDPRWKLFVDQHDVAEPDLSHIEFNPELPTAIRESLESRSGQL